MAKSKATPLDDTERCINYRSGSTSQTNMAVHINSGLSVANRRLYPQLRCYRAKIEIVRWTPGDALYMYKFYTLSNAWWVKQAIRLAKKTWLDHSKEERAALKGSRAKWFDFQIECGKTAGDADFLQFDHDFAVQEMVFDELLTDAQKFYLARREGAPGDSESFADLDEIGFTVDATVEGTTTTVYNIFDEYIKNLNIDPDSDTRSEGAYADLVSVDQIAQEALQTIGDEPPWDADAFPSPWVLRSILTSEGNIAGRSTGFMDCPLGVIMVQKMDDSNSGVNYTNEDEFCLHLAKGKYRGIHAPSY